MKRRIGLLAAIVGLTAMGYSNVDFNKDGIPDIIMENNVYGYIKAWKIKSSMKISKEYWITDLKTSDWQIFTDFSDIDGDGHTDILLQNRRNGKLSALRMNGFTLESKQNLAKPGSSWRIIGVTDINSDGYRDILLQNFATGVVKAIETKNGLKFKQAKILFKPGKNWKAYGVKDLNGDGLDDILLQNKSNGKLRAYKLSSNAPARKKEIGSPGFNWTIVGIDDMNGDQVNDVVLQNHIDGRIKIYTMSENFQSRIVTIRGVGKEWRVRNVKDMNRDGNGDILFRYRKSAAFKIMHFDEHLSSTVQIIGRKGTDHWKTIDVADYNGDGVDDIVLQNDTTAYIKIVAVPATGKGRLKKVGSPHGQVWSSIGNIHPWSPIRAFLNNGPTMAAKRMGHWTLPSVAGSIELIGGHGTDFTALNSSEKWIAAGNAFTTAVMQYTHDYCAVTKLSKNRWLIAGGAGDLGIAPGHAGAEIFDALHNTFSTTGSMIYKRMGNAAVTLKNGNVLMVGGWYNNDSAANTEVYHIDTGTFLQSAALLTPRAYPWALPTKDGKAVVFWGIPAYGGATIESAELYDPDQNTFSQLTDHVLGKGWSPFMLNPYQPASTRLMKNGQYLFAAVNYDMNQTTLMSFDPSAKEFIKISVTPKLPIPTKKYLVNVLVDNNRNLAYLFFITRGSDPQELTLYTVDLTWYTSRELKPTFTLPTQYYMGDSGFAVLKDGRVLITGGHSETGYDTNFSPVDKTFFIEMK